MLLETLTEDQFGALIIVGSALVVVVLLFLIFRAFMNWYFRIDVRYREMRRQTYLLNELVKKMGGEPLEMHRSASKLREPYEEFSRETK